MKPIDARTLPAATLRTGVCVVGAGAAGISLAVELAGSDVDVLLVESGGYEIDAATQALYRGENVAHGYFPLEACRLRFFGGTTNHWAGVSRELDPIDFERREAFAWSGWPFDAAELAPHYERARKLCELGPRVEKFDGLGFPADRFETQAVYFSPPTRFGAKYRGVLEDATNVRILLHANAVEVEPSRRAGRVDRIRFATLEGGEFTVEARCFVLALGGLENPRLLLASRSVHSAGVGNRHDLVGRFFMEHPHVRIGTWLLSDSSIHRPLYDWPNPDGGYRGKHMGLLTLPAATLRDEDLLGWSAELRLTTASQESEAYQSLRTLLKSLRQGKAPDDSGRHVRAILDDLGGAADGLWQQVTGDPGADAQYELIVRSEQAPDPESRVTLGDEKDALGVPRIDLAWRVGDADVATIRRGLEILAAEVGRLGWGRVQIPEPEEDWSDKIHGGWHHMGTTRMADDPKRGVVDSDCRVHGLENLYVAGSSVFPTAGWANPTLTLVALAVRTAHHLKARLSEGAPPT